MHLHLLTGYKTVWSAAPQIVKNICQISNCICLNFEIYLHLPTGHTKLFGPLLLKLLNIFAKTTQGICNLPLQRGHYNIHFATPQIRNLGRKAPSEDL